MIGVILGLLCAFALGVVIAFAIVAYVGHRIAKGLFG